MYIQHFLLVFESLFIISVVTIELEYQIDRILSKRSTGNAIINMMKDNPSSKCRNGGVWENRKCHCIYPNIGVVCEDFACAHGISVGRRFDPNSFLFSKPCICNEGWQGDLCEYHLTDRCNQKGEWINDRCECIEPFFGNECQFTSKCVQGHIKHGRCICHKNFEGENCDRAVCFHGYLDLKNNSLSCVCPAKYKGGHCDMCVQSGPKILPYPHCTVDVGTSHALRTRKKATKQNSARVAIIFGSTAILIIFFAIAVLLHLIKRKRHPEEEARRKVELAARKEKLKQDALRVRMSIPDNDVTVVSSRSQGKRLSLPSLFRIRRSASSDRTLKLREVATPILEHPTKTEKDDDDISEQDLFGTTI